MAIAKDEPADAAALLEHAHLCCSAHFCARMCRIVAAACYPNSQRELPSDRADELTTFCSGPTAQLEKADGIGYHMAMPEPSCEHNRARKRCLVCMKERFFLRAIPTASVLAYLSARPAVARSLRRGSEP
jgi:hypothetical protein